MSRFNSVSVIVILFVLFSLSLNEPLFAVDLNAPAEKKVTIGSEIKRGLAAISDRTRDAMGELVATQDAIFSVLEQEKQRNTDTDAFYLGAYYRAFLEMKIAVDANKEHPGMVSAQQLQVAEDTTATFFREFRQKQAEMHIDDATFYKAISDSGPSPEQKAMLREWDVKTAIR